MAIHSVFFIAKQKTHKKTKHFSVTVKYVLELFTSLPPPPPFPILFLVEMLDILFLMQILDLYFWFLRLTAQAFIVETLCLNPLGPRPAAALLLWNPMQREVTATNDPGIQL